MKVDNKILIEFSHIFPDENIEKPSVYIQNCEKLTVLEVCCFFMGLNEAKTRIDEHEYLKYHFFTEIADRDFYWSRLDGAYNSLGKNAILFNQISTLTLIELILNLEDKSVPKLKDSELEVSLLKAYLAINSEVVKQQNVARESTKDQPEEIKSIGTILSINLPSADFLNYNLKGELVSQFIKSYLLFEFLENSYPVHLNAFIASRLSKDVTNWKLFLNLLLAFVFDIVKFSTREDSWKPLIISHKPSDLEILLSFTATLIDNVKHETDFADIRARPILRINENSIRLLSKIFTVELFYKSLYFHFREINENAIPPEHKIKNFKSTIGDEFSERYLLDKVMQKYLSNGAKTLKHSDFIKTTATAPPDYYIRKGEDIYLIEAKDTLLNGKDKMSYDYNIYEKELSRRFIQSKGKKGILQLINTIKLIKKGDFSLDPKASNKNIYPIIIVFDKQLDVMAINKWLNYYYEKFLLSEDVDMKNVKPITLINIDSFIQEGPHFLNGKIKLSYLLDQYHKSAAIFPFSLFIDHFIADRKLRYDVSWLKELGLNTIPQ